MGDMIVENRLHNDSKPGRGDIAISLNLITLPVSTGVKTAGQRRKTYSTKQTPASQFTFGITALTYTKCASQNG